MLDKGEIDNFVVFRDCLSTRLIEKYEAGLSDRPQKRKSGKKGMAEAAGSEERDVVVEDLAESQSSQM